MATQSIPPYGRTKYYHLFGQFSVIGHLSWWQLFAIIKDGCDVHSRRQGCSRVNS